MTTDNVNRFEGFESENGGNERSSYNRENSWNNDGHRAPRQRFVRNADGTTRPQRPRFNREEGAPRYIVSRGFVYVRESEEMMDRARALAETTLNKRLSSGSRDWTELKTALRDELSRFFFREPNAMR